MDHVESFWDPPFISNSKEALEEMLKADTDILLNSKDNSDLTPLDRARNFTVDN